MVAFKSGTQAGGFVTLMGVAQGGLVGLSNGRFSTWDTRYVADYQYKGSYIKWFVVDRQFLTINTDSALDVTDAIGILDTWEKQLFKNFTDATGVTDTVAKTQVKAKTDDVGIFSQIFFTVRKGLASILGLSDSIDLTLVSEGHGHEHNFTGSLVDQKRQTIEHVLEIDGSKLTINDLLHMYWSMDFAADHEYNGSESPLQDETHSTMDHFAEVQKNEGGILNWIRSVIP